MAKKSHFLEKLIIAQEIRFKNSSTVVVLWPKKLEIEKAFFHFYKKLLKQTYLEDRHF
jgi:hypothetical protein